MGDPMTDLPNSVKDYVDKAAAWDAVAKKNEQITTLVKALQHARKAIWSGGDSISIIGKIDAALESVGAKRRPDHD
jgi:hypothetical protein